MKQAIYVYLFVFFVMNALVFSINMIVYPRECKEGGIKSRWQYVAIGFNAGCNTGKWMLEEVK